MWVLYIPILVVLVPFVAPLYFFLSYVLPLFLSVPKPGRSNSKADERRLEGPWSDEYLEVNDVRLHYVTAGTGPLMLLLHGFPEFWYSWRYQIPEFSKDHKVVALDMRGYNLSSKPEGKSAYRMENLVGDVYGVIEKLAQKKGECILVAHDWGGIVAWAFAYSHPEMLSRLVVMDTGHPISLSAVFNSFNLEQLKKSSYIFIFQLPVLSERIVASEDYKTVASAFKSKKRGVVNRDNITDGDVELFKDAVAKPGALSAMIHYYRNLPAYMWKRKKLDVLQVPTLCLHGEKDEFIGKESLDVVPEYVRDLKIVILPNCSHWINQDDPQAVNREIREFLNTAQSDG